MNACPSDDELLRFLDGEFDADRDARIVAHVESCADCQEKLELLTRGLLATARGASIDTVRNDPGHEVPQDRTGVDDPRSVTGDAVGRRSLDLPRDADATIDPAEDPDTTQDHGFDLNPAPGGETDEGTGGGATRGAGPIGAIGDVPGAHEAGRKGRDQSTTEWPVVPGYDILQPLGEGGMGVVYKARHLGLNRLVALKMIRGGSLARSDHFTRFRVEAESVARLRHPNIIQIYDIGEAGGLPFVALELLDGGSLDERLARNPQPGRRAAELMTTLARAVHVAHESGIVHRDLKPANVLYTSDGVPKVTDFGLAKRIDSDAGQTQSGQIMGSPSYMAPEQARGHSRNVGPAADVYALGAILYEMLTGRPPFKGETPMETVRQVIDDDPVTPSRLVPRVPRDLETIALKCLHKDPARRYPSARALADDLRRFLDGKPIEARRTPAWERGAKWAVRRPWAAMTGAAGILAVAAIVIGVVASERGQRLAQQRRQARNDGVESAALTRVQAAEAARSPDELQEASDRLTDSLRDIARERELQDEPRLEQINGIVAARKNMLDAQLAAIRSRVAARQRLETFRGRRNETQLRDALPLIVESDRRTLRTVATAALMVYARDSKAPAVAWTPDLALADGLETAERTEVIDGCFDLLLLLSQAEDPAEGLTLLDHAARLRPELTPAYHVRRAASLGQAGDTEGRVREERLARALKPATASDHLLIGRDHVIRNDLREAIRSLKTAIRLDPSQLGAHLWLARANFQSGRFREAEISLNTCIGDAPDLLGLYLFRAVVYREEAAAAIGSGDRSSTLRLEAADALANAEADFRRVLNGNPSPEFRYAVLVNRGVMQFQVGQLGESVNDLESAVRLDPGPYEAHVQLFHVRRRQGRLAEAAAALDRAIERRPDRADLFRARALLVAGSVEADGDRAKEQDQARRDAALRDWERAIGLQAGNSPQKAEDHAERGRLLFASGRAEAALADCDAALKIDPGNRKALRLRASVLLAQKRYDEVLAACDAALARDRPSVDLLEVRGLGRLERKDFAGAIDDYTVALSMAPGSAALHDRRGWAYLFSDAFGLALADFDAAVRLDSRLGDAYGGRALARVGLGEWRKALVDAEDAVRLVAAPRKHRAYFNAARVHAHALRFAGEEVSRQGEAALAFYRRIRGRASALLLESARQLPPRERAAFSRDVVASDPALKPFLPGPG